MWSQDQFPLNGDPALHWDDGGKRIINLLLLLLFLTNNQIENIKQPVLTANTHKQREANTLLVNITE